MILISLFCFIFWVIYFENLYLLIVKVCFVLIEVVFAVFIISELNIFIFFFKSLEVFVKSLDFKELLYISFVKVFILCVGENFFGFILKSFIFILNFVIVFAVLIFVSLVLIIIIFILIIYFFFLFFFCKYSFYLNI